ncbi:MAG: heavy metal-responsive transcriptional regulator [Kiloniellales bacterium]|jgi:DNA-binding transcriptional MerR regulator
MSLERMTIGQLARKTGVTPRAIRHYERLSLIRAPIRTAANYRVFDGDSVARVRFIANCRTLGFSIPEIGELLRTIDDPNHTCSQIAELTQQHLDLVGSKISDLMEMHRTLNRNLSKCTGMDVPDCAVLEFLNEPA